MKQEIKNMQPRFFLLCASFMLLLFAGNAQATSVIADSPCDSLYYESLSARAWLEAQREITQNQNLILKPDSVFEYTCFDLMVHELADHAENMLSETDNYNSGLGDNSMDQALDALVLNALEDYITNNFADYHLLGGHTAGIPFDHNPSTIGGSTQSYTCNIMANVWNAAKCINFISNPTTDGFYTFDEYAAAAALTLDARHLPTMCSAVPTSWTANIANALTSGPWTNDDVITYLGETTPQDCSSAGSNCQCTGSPAIPTGVRVVRSGYTVNNYDEHICLQPGCFYHPGGPLNGGSPGAGCYAF
ncbi:MAG: hypothetical protein ACRBDL_11595 [Alphaproteobacteria bacterium]